MNLKDAVDVVDYYMKKSKPVFMWGPPGVGKTDFATQLGKRTERLVLDWRTNLREPVDARGLPVPDLERSVTRWLRPNDLPFEGSDFPDDTIVFLDEANTAAPSMQVVAMQLVHERRVGEHRLKSGVYILAAGNRQSDRAAAQRMPSALANRFAHVDIEPDPDAWQAWAAQNDIDPMVMAFLRWRPSCLHNMAGSDLRAFPTPRTWADVSDIADAPADLLMPLVTGLVGEGATGEFMSFVRTYRDLPSLDYVLANPESVKVPQDPSARFALSVGLARKVTEKTFAAGITFVRRLPREFEIVFTVDAVRRDAGLSHTQAFVDWATRNSDVTLG